MSSFSERLSCAVLTAQLSDSDVSRWFGVSRNAVINWLQGRTEPVKCREDIIYKLLEILENNADIISEGLSDYNGWDRLRYVRKIRDSSLSQDDIDIARLLLPLF